MPRPFSDGDLDAAAALLAARHARHRQAEPLLPADVDFRGEVEALWRRPGASGAICDDGFLIGAPSEDPVWGPNVWVQAAGHAAQEPETVRELYALAAQRWVDEGNTRHYAVVPAEPALVDAWFRLGFGQQQAVAVRELPQQVDWPEGVREARVEDVETLVALAPLLSDHQAVAPVFGGGRAGWDEEGLRRQILEDIAADDAAVLLAGDEGAFYVVPFADQHAPLVRPPGSAFLPWAATRPEVRGTGVGLRLTQAAFAWARSRGHDVIATDWRVTNLLSSRFWPRRGFRTTFLRLYRSIP